MKLWNIAALVGALLTGAIPALAQESDPLTAACELVAMKVVSPTDGGAITEMKSVRTHRQVTVEWMASGAKYEHYCSFLSGEARVPELVHTETRKGNGTEIDFRIDRQNEIIWVCMVTMPNHEFCAP